MQPSRISPVSPVANLAAGLGAPFRALALLARNRQLWGYIGMPVLVNLVVGALLYGGLYVALLRALEAWLGAGGEGFAGFLIAVLRVVLALTLGVGIGFLLVRFGVVLGAPWYGQLSEQLEALLAGQRPPPSKLSVRSVAYDIWRALQFELKKLTLVLLIWLPSLLLLLLPVAGAALYTASGLALGAIVSCLDFFDGPLERRRRSFRTKLGLIRRSLPGSIAFGLLAFVVVSVPLLNLLAIPLFVAAGTIFVIEQGLQAA